MAGAPPQPSAPDAVIVLGAALSAPGVAGPALKRRVIHGAKVFTARGVGHLVVSGGIVGPPPAEARVMRSVAIECGVPDERIVIEDRAINTFENAVYCGGIIRERGWRQVVIVTDAFHMPRALYVFRRLGFTVSGDAVPRQAGASRFRWYRAYFRELWALAFSAWLFRIGRHKPIVDAVWRR